LFKRRSGITHDDVCALASLHVPAVVGEEVHVLQIPDGQTASGGNFWARGVCVSSVGEGASTTFSVQPLVITGRGRRACSPEKDVPAARIRDARSIICTLHDTRVAAKLEDDMFAGACPGPRERGGWERTSAERSEITATFVRSKSVVAVADGGGNTARTGVRWMLKQGIPTLLKRLNKLLLKAGQTPSSESHFRAIVGGREYTKLTAEKCCCATCRDLGFVVYELLREVVVDLCAIMPGDTTKLSRRLIDDIDAEERFRAGEYRTHLKEESSCDRHCLRNLLSAENEPEFRVNCTHGRSDGRVLDEPKTMEQRAKPRKVQSSAWQDECSICYASYEDNASRLLCCENCPRVAHKRCILEHHADLGDSSAPWTCFDCASDKSRLQHDERCVQCEKNDSLISDLLALVEVARASVSGASASEQHQVCDWAGATVQKSALDLASYHGHIARDVNQGMFQAFLTSILRWDSYTTIYDYWAKQSDRRHMTATCEGQANIGTSCSGRCFTFLNPSQETRGKYPDVPWSTFPPAPSREGASEQGGPALCRVFHRAFSDSSTQDPHDTAATLLVEERDFRASSPWLTNNIGDMSDNASNYKSTSPALYNVNSPFANVKCFSVEGEGKDGVDRDNGSEQQKLRAHVDAGGNLTCATEYVSVCNARRHKGSVNARVEIDKSHDLSPDEKKQRKAIEGIGYMQFYSCPFGGDLTLWELFSRSLSVERGTLVGYGPGRVITHETLRKNHLLDRHSLPYNAAVITYADQSSLAEGEDLRLNPASLRSKAEKKAALAAGEVQKAEAAETRTARVEEKEAKLLETFNMRRSSKCLKCNALFRSEKALAMHLLRGCGRSGARVQRRLAHDAGTIKARVKVRKQDFEEAGF
jgi:hypothetical protein